MLAAPQVKRYPAIAEVAKLVDALDLGSSAYGMRVRVPPSVLKDAFSNLYFYQGK